MTDYYPASGILDQILRWSQEGMNQKRIADLLNEAGAKTESGRSFDQPAVSRLIGKYQKLGLLPAGVTLNYGPRQRK